MRELTIHELETVSGGFNLGGMMTGITYYTLLNGSAGIATYAWGSAFAGNKISIEGVAGGAVGGLVGGIKKLPGAAVIGGLTGAAVEGTLNGRGLIPTLFAQRQQHLEATLAAAGV